jgi:hypothetical protein
MRRPSGDALYNLVRCAAPDADAGAGARYPHRILGADPRDAQALGLLGVTLREAGRIEEARAALGRALDFDPGQGGHYYDWAKLGTIAAGDPRIAAMEALAARDQAAPAADRSYPRMALGKAYDDTGRPDEAFAMLSAGNRLKRAAVADDEAAAEGRFERIRRIFTPELLHAGSGSGSETDLPIFVVGFPRSGTTLVEQVLASHPQVAGAGEVGYLQHWAVSFRPRAAGDAGFPEYCPALLPTRSAPSARLMSGDCAAWRLRPRASPTSCRRPISSPG